MNIGKKLKLKFIVFRAKAMLSAVLLLGFLLAPCVWGDGAGVVQFSSSAYSVDETEQSITITVNRERGVIGELFQCQVIDLDRFTPLFRFDEPFCPLVPGAHGISYQVPVLGKRFKSESINGNRFIPFCFGAVSLCPLVTDHMDKVLVILDRE